MLKRRESGEQHAGLTVMRNAGFDVRSKRRAASRAHAGRDRHVIDRNLAAA